MMERTRRGPMELFVTVKGTLFFTMMTSAKIMAIKFLKKLFCIEGRSPDSRTKRFIQEKQKAEQIIKKIPRFFDFFIFSQAPIDSVIVLDAGILGVGSTKQFLKISGLLYYIPFFELCNMCKRKDNPLQSDILIVEKIQQMSYNEK